MRYLIVLLLIIVSGCAHRPKSPSKETKYKIGQTVCVLEIKCEVTNVRPFDDDVLYHVMYVDKCGKIQNDIFWESHVKDCN